jgi:hypothetical protein
VYIRACHNATGWRDRSELGGNDGNAPTVASEFGLWGFRRVYSSQLPNDRTIGDARVHLTVNSTVNAPDVPSTLTVGEFAA